MKTIITLEKTVTTVPLIILHQNDNSNITFAAIFLHQCFIALALQDKSISVIKRYKAAFDLPRSSTSILERAL